MTTPAFNETRRQWLMLLLCLGGGSDGCIPVDDSAQVEDSSGRFLDAKEVFSPMAEVVVEEAVLALATAAV